MDKNSPFVLRQSNNSGRMQNNNSPSHPLVERMKGNLRTGNQDGIQRSLNAINQELLRKK